MDRSSRILPDARASPPPRTAGRRDRFMDWLTAPTPRALTGADNDFDSRPLYGGTTLTDELRKCIAGYTTGSALFLRVLGQDAPETTTGMGMIHAFSTDDDPARRGSLDFELHGTRNFVDATLLCAARAHTVVDLRLIRVDLARLLPALFRGTSCDSLDDWLEYVGIAGTGRHEAVGDAWTTARLALVAFDAAERAGMRTSGDLVAMQKAQVWLGTRR